MVASLLLSITAFATTTTLGCLAPAVEQSISTYDAGSIPVVSCNTLTAPEASAQHAPCFGLIAKLDAAKSPVVIGENMARVEATGNGVRAGH